jgi:hypothetical protein
MFGHWRDLAAKERKEAQKQKHVSNFFKKLTLHLQIYTVLNTIFGCASFLFDAILYFLHNLVIR